MAPNNIMGGTDVVSGEYSWLINRNLKCGGSMITSEWILTAGHCAFEPGDLVALNKLDLFGSPSKEDETISVSQSLAHPKFQRSATAEENDIRLVKLSSPSHVFPARLATSEEAELFEQAGTLLTVAGWGALEEGGKIAGRLREVQLPVVSNAVCADADHYLKIRQIYPTMMCAGYAEGGRDACTGDSGSPLFKEVNGQGVILGITSWGVGCGRPNRPGVYTRVSKYIDWISSVLNGTYVPTSLFSTPSMPSSSMLLPPPVSSFILPDGTGVTPVSTEVTSPSLTKTSAPVPSLAPFTSVKSPQVTPSLQELSSTLLARYLQPISSTLNYPSVSKALAPALANSRSSVPRPTPVPTVMKSPWIQYPTTSRITTPTSMTYYTSRPTPSLAQPTPISSFQDSKSNSMQTQALRSQGILVSRPESVPSSKSLDSVVSLPVPFTPQTQNFQDVNRLAAINSRFEPFSDVAFPSSSQFTFQLTPYPTTQLVTSSPYQPLSKPWTSENVGQTLFSDSSTTQRTQDNIGLSPFSSSPQALSLSAFATPYQESAQMIGGVAYLPDVLSSSVAFQNDAVASSSRSPQSAQDGIDNTARQSLRDRSLPPESVGPTYNDRQNQLQQQTNWQPSQIFPSDSSYAELSQPRDQYQPYTFQAQASPGTSFLDPIRANMRMQGENFQTQDASTFSPQMSRGKGAGNSMPLNNIFPTQTTRNFRLPSAPRGKKGL